MRPPINPDFSALVAEYERKHGAVQTTPIIIKSPAKAAQLQTGIKQKQEQSHTVVWNGKTCLSNDLAAEHGVRGDTFRARLKRGWSVEKAVGISAG